MGNAPVKEVASAVNSGGDAGGMAEAATGGTAKSKCKACCACPETKRARDQCIVENGEENCTKLIEAHKKCMRDAGFNI